MWFSEILKRDILYVFRILNGFQSVRLVIYYCITNYPKLQQCKSTFTISHISVISHSLHQYRITLAEWFWLKISQEVAIMMLTRNALNLRA